MLWYFWTTINLNFSQLPFFGLKRITPINSLNTSVKTSAGILSPFSIKAYTAVQQVCFDFLGLGKGVTVWRRKRNQKYGEEEEEKWRIRRDVEKENPKNHKELKRKGNWTCHLTPKINSFNLFHLSAGNLDRIPVSKKPMPRFQECRQKWGSTVLETPKQIMCIFHCYY